MIIETREGNRYLVIKNNDKLFCISYNDVWFSLGTFNNLTHMYFKKFDIVKIYKFKKDFFGTYLNALLNDKNNYLDLVWERQNDIELSKQQIIEKLNLNIKPENLIITD